jgi:hypothetical protein
MSISVYADTAKSTLVCGPGAIGRVCQVEAGTTFSIDVVAGTVPAAGYTAYQGVVEYDSLLTLVQQPGRTENRWPEALPDCPSGTESKPANRYQLRCDDLTVSFHEGAVMNVHFTCPIGGGLAQLDLVGGTGLNVSYYFKPSIMGNFTYLKSVSKGSLLVADSVTINCDTDTDDDGCENVREVLPKVQAHLGGGRDPYYFWDFYDTPNPNAVPQRNRVVDLDDIVRVAMRFGLTGNPLIDPLSTPPKTGYHPAYDRGDLVGPNAWNVMPADGVIDLDDVITASLQFAHNCN